MYTYIYVFNDILCLLMCNINRWVSPKHKFWLNNHITENAKVRALGAHFDQRGCPTDPRKKWFVWENAQTVIDGKLDPWLGNLVKPNSFPPYSTEFDGVRIDQFSTSSVPSTSTSTSTSASSSTKKTMCMWWKVGKCKNANTCSFLHSGERVLGDCINWTSRNYCKFGDKCKYKHTSKA